MNIERTENGLFRDGKLIEMKFKDQVVRVSPTTTSMSIQGYVHSATTAELACLFGEHDFQFEEDDEKGHTVNFAGTFITDDGHTIPFKIMRWTWKEKFDMAESFTWKIYGRRKELRDMVYLALDIARHERDPSWIRGFDGFIKKILS